MNFALLWIDALVAWLLWVAAFAAVVGRIKRKWIRVVLMCLVNLVPFAWLGGSVFLAAVVKFEEQIAHDWFGYFVSLFSAFLIGTLMILRRASRRKSGLTPAASTWPRGQLIFACLAVATVGYITLCNMDFAFRTRCAVLSMKINSLYLATLPANVSDPQNAAPIYEKAFERLRDDPPTDVNNPPTGNNVTFDPNEPATLSFLSRQAATITLLRQAATLPGCRFDQDLEDLYVAELVPELNDERTAANVLKLHAMEEAAHGHSASAMADVAAIYAMSRQFCQRPLLVSGLVGISIDGLADESLEEMLPTVKIRDDLSPLHLEQVPSLCLSLRQNLRTEESYGLAQIGNTPSEIRTVHGKPAEDTSFVSLTEGSRRGKLFRVFYVDLDAYLNLMQKYQDLAIQPYYLARDQLPNSYTIELYFGSKEGFTTEDIGDLYSKMFKTWAIYEARDACASAAVAMTRFRLDHATLPSHLADLVPAYLDAVPTDPFNGQPLRLVTHGGRWIIYSVGPNGVDDGGVAPNFQHGFDTGNIIFTLKQP